MLVNVFAGVFAVAPPPVRYLTVKVVFEGAIPYVFVKIKLDGEYAVFGSAPLVVTGMINDVNDLDVIIRPRSWEFGNDGEYRTEDIEFFNKWPGFDVDDLIDNHTFEYKGVLFVYPEKVIEYKRKMNRLKDQDLI